MNDRADTLLYVYAVIEAAPAELGFGLEGAPLRAVAGGSLASVVSEHEQAPEAAEEALWQHEAVVEKLLEGGAVLPLRFGTTVADDGDLKALLRSREAEFVGLLELVRGAVELSVRAELPAADTAVLPSGEATEGKTGTEYMRDRGRALDAAERAKEAFHRPLEELARRSLVLDARMARLGPAGSFRGAYLVDGSRVEAFAERVDGLAQELGAEVACTGPWPPYSFVGRAE